jgi:signal transduction histidine kinase
MRIRKVEYKFKRKYNTILKIKILFFMMLVEKGMLDELRKSGVDIVGDVPWGTHFCQFYQTKDDLISVLVPYFKAGLENNEFCMWVTSELLDVEDAKEALRKVVSDIDSYLEKGQIEIIPYPDWYLEDGIFDSERVLNGWVEKLNNARAQNYDGFRLTGNTFWLEKKDLNDFFNYEKDVNNVIGNYQMMVLCTYCLDKCSAAEIIDVVVNHQFALIKREKKWELIESVKHKITADKLKKTQQTYSSLFNNMMDGYAYCEMLYDDENHPVDFIYLNVNDAFERLTGIKNVESKKVCEVIPDIAEAHPELLEIYGRVASTGRAEKFEIEFKPLGIWLSVAVFSPEKNYFIATFDNFTERKLAEKELERTLDELKRSNQELEQFAYVASHDLQEPLRMVSSFTQLLEMKYKDELDAEALEYIGFAVDGAKRMQLLINDLLEYSRVTRKSTEFEAVNIEKVLDEVLFNLEIVIEENQAIIIRESLPEIQSDYGQMVQLFQNLIGNALKYRSEETPEIRISAQKEDDHWIFSVADNGIGMDSEYFVQVFKIFRRLNTQDEHEGTGIGLAITKRIIEHHGGRIWVESEPGKGSTFYFTIPKTVNNHF